MLTYRLSIHPSLAAYQPELDYVCAVLDQWYDIQRNDTASCILHYGPQPPKGAVVVYNEIFPNAVRLDAAGIHPTAYLSQVTPTQDWLGLMFLCLSRLEERDSPAKDQYGRFPFHAALSGTEPVADYAAHRLAVLVTGNDSPPLRTTYSIRLTHDVDRLQGWLWNDPERATKCLMAQAEQVGVQARFFLMGPSEHPMDSPYAITHIKRLRRLQTLIVQRRHLIGFHPGFLTATKPWAWRAQRRGLQAILGQVVMEGRQHVLQYDATITPDIWADAGMQTDYTLAYPERPGFRSGTCRPHFAYSLTQRKALALTHINTAIMDFSFFGGKYRTLTMDEALAECQPVIQTCRQYGGTLVILQHLYQPWAFPRSFYPNLLEMVR